MEVYPESLLYQLDPPEEADVKSNFFVFQIIVVLCLLNIKL